MVSTGEKPFLRQNQENVSFYQFTGSCCKSNQTEGNSPWQGWLIASKISENKKAYMIISLVLKITYYKILKVQFLDRL